MAVDEGFASIAADPTFQAQPQNTRERVARNYFISNMADDSFYALPEDHQNKIISNFSREGRMAVAVPEVQAADVGVDNGRAARLAAAPKDTQDLLWRMARGAGTNLAPMPDTGLKGMLAGSAAEGFGNIGTGIEGLLRSATAGGSGIPGAQFMTPPSWNDPAAWADHATPTLPATAPYTPLAQPMLDWGQHQMDLSNSSTVPRFLAYLAGQAIPYTAAMAAVPEAVLPDAAGGVLPAIARGSIENAAAAGATSPDGQRLKNAGIASLIGGGAAGATSMLMPGTTPAEMGQGMQVLPQLQLPGPEGMRAPDFYEPIDVEAEPAFQPWPGGAYDLKTATTPQEMGQGLPLLSGAPPREALAGTPQRAALPAPEPTAENVTPQQLTGGPGGGGLDTQPYPYLPPIGPIGFDDMPAPDFEGMQTPLDPTFLPALASNVPRPPAILPPMADSTLTPPAEHGPLPSLDLIQMVKSRAQQEVPTTPAPASAHDAVSENIPDLTTQGAEATPPRGTAEIVSFGPKAPNTPTLSNAYSQSGGADRPPSPYYREQSEQSGPQELTPDALIREEYLSEKEAHVDRLKQLRNEFDAASPARKAQIEQEIMQSTREQHQRLADYDKYLSERRAANWDAAYRDVHGTSRPTMEEVKSPAPNRQFTQDDKDDFFGEGKYAESQATPPSGPNIPYVKNPKAMLVPFTSREGAGGYTWQDMKERDISGNFKTREDALAQAPSGYEHIETDLRPIRELDIQREAALNRPQEIRLRGKVHDANWDSVDEHGRSRMVSRPTVDFFISNADAPFLNRLDHESVSSLFPSVDLSEIADIKKFRAGELQPASMNIAFTSKEAADRALQDANKFVTNPKHAPVESQEPPPQQVAPQYSIPHRPAADGPAAHDLAGGDMPNDIYDHPEYYGDLKDKGTRESFLALKKIRGKPDAEITIYRAAPQAELNPGDWVSTSKTYATQHGMGDDPSADVPVHAFRVKAKDLKWSRDDLNEFGYFPEAQHPSPVAASEPDAPTLPPGVIYKGEQPLDSATAKRWGVNTLPQYDDAVTGNTFSPRPGEDIQAYVDKLRAKYQPQEPANEEANAAPRQAGQEENAPAIPEGQKVRADGGQGERLQPQVPDAGVLPPRDVRKSYTPGNPFAEKAIRARVVHWTRNPSIPLDKEFRGLGLHVGEFFAAEARAHSQHGGRGTEFSPYKSGEEYHPFEMTLRNTIRLTDKGGWMPSEIASELRKKGIIDRPAEKAINKKLSDLLASGMARANAYEETEKGIANILKARGYDGIVYKNRYELPSGGTKRFHDSYIVFEPRSLRYANPPMEFASKYDNQPIPWAKPQEASNASEVSQTATLHGHGEQPAGPGQAQGGGQEAAAPEGGQGVRAQAGEVGKIIARNVTKKRAIEIVREAGGGAVHPDPENPKRFMVAQEAEKPPPKPQRTEGPTLYSGISPRDFVEGAKQIHKFLLGDEGIVKGMAESGKAEIQKARDEFARMGGHAYPALARIGGPDLSAAASRLDASHDYAQAQADAFDAHLRAIAKAHKVPFREAMRFTGAALAEGRLRGIKAAEEAKGTPEGDNAASNVVTTVKPELAKRIQAWQQAYTSDKAKLDAMPAGLAKDKLAADLETRKRMLHSWRMMHSESPFDSEADVHKALAHPVVQALAKYIEHNAAPITSELYKASSKRKETDQFGQPIEPPVKNAFFPFHMSLYPAIEDEIAPGGKLPTGGNVKNTREKHSVLEQAAKGSGGYVLDADKQLRNMMMKSTLPGRHAQLFDAAEKAGIGVTATRKDAPTEIGGQPVVRFERKLNRHTPAKDEGFYVRQDAADEFRRALAIDKPLKPWEKALRPLAYIQLAGVQDAVSHVANNVANATTKYVGSGVIPTVGGKTGFLAANSVGKVPQLLNSVGTRMVGILLKDPATMDRLAQMTSEGASQPRHGTPAWYNAVGQSGRGVRVVTDAMRLAVHDGYNDAVKLGLLPDDAATRRDYVNQAGNYYRNSSSTLTTALKDIQAAPFITAGIGRLANQARFALGADPGIRTGGMRNNLQHRAAAITILATGLALVGIANYLSTGHMRPPGVPHGGLYIGKDADGRPRYIPVMELTSLPGAERMTGAGSVISNMENQQDMGSKDDTLTQFNKAWESSSAGDKMRKSIAGQLLSPFAGPAVSSAALADTGFDVHQQREVAPPRSNAAVREAMRGMNPMVQSLTDTGDNQEGVWGVLGKLAPRTGQNQSDMRAGVTKDLRAKINVPLADYRHQMRQIQSYTKRHPGQPLPANMLPDLKRAAQAAAARH